MTFASLKKKSPSASPESLSVDDFIDDAENYARGISKVVTLHPEPPGYSGEPLRSHCFTLSEEVWGKLDRLSELSGISRSRLLRILLNDLQPETDLPRFLASQVR
ncbi:replication protein RepA [Bowmanella dokdonensis]|uniref:Replication protein RepA n=1 Tax=Bowmanella dokdonensis TaxID=751969 RepID=A0A939DLE1_9ALTE|nr:replication protein RepA [Bowmanella dokdonensis]MBN7824001.1 replication protein RepA [Bowmanella dokdonensis]